MWGRSLIVCCLLAALTPRVYCDAGVWTGNASLMPVAGDQSEGGMPRTYDASLTPVGTAFGRFTSAVAAAGSLTIVTEVGDKTFFVAAMLATKYAKLPVFLGSVAALWLQTLGCSVIGSLVHQLPSHRSGWMAWPLDDYLAALLLFIFGVFHLKDGIWPSAEPEEDLVHDLESVSSPICGGKADPKNDNALMENLLPVATAATSQATTPSSLPPPARPTRRLSVGSARAIAEASAELNRSPSLTTDSKRSVFYKAFWLVTVAEFGDRSMFSTMALAASQNPYGVFIGASLGHAVVTILAVTCAMMLHQYMSERATNLLGGTLFLMFGVLSLVEGLVRQGVVDYSFL